MRWFHDPHGRTCWRCLNWVETFRCVCAGCGFRVPLRPCDLTDIAFRMSRGESLSSVSRDYGMASPPMLMSMRHSMLCKDKPSIEPYSSWVGGIALFDPCWFPKAFQTALCGAEIVLSRHGRTRHEWSDGSAIVVGEMESRDGRSSALHWMMGLRRGEMGGDSNEMEMVPRPLVVNRPRKTHLRISYISGKKSRGVSRGLSNAHLMTRELLEWRLGLADDQPVSVVEEASLERRTNQRNAVDVHWNLYGLFTT